MNAAKEEGGENTARALNVLTTYANNEVGMNTAMDEQGGMKTARPLTDLKFSIAARGQLNVIVVPGDEDILYRSRSACGASRTATTYDNTPSRAHAGQPTCDEQLTTTTSIMPSNMSAAANMRHGAVLDNDGASVGEDRAISTTRQCLTTDTTTTMGATLNDTSPAATTSI